MTGAQATLLGVGVGAVLGWVGALIQGRMQRGEGDRQRAQESELRRLDRLDEAYRVTQAFVTGWKDYVQRLAGWQFVHSAGDHEPEAPPASSGSDVAPAELYASQDVRSQLNDFTAAVRSFNILTGQSRRGTITEAARLRLDELGRGEIVRRADELLTTMRRELEGHRGEVEDAPRRPERRWKRSGGR